MSNLLHILQCVYNCHPADIIRNAINRQQGCLESHYYKRSSNEPCMFDNDLNGNSGMSYPYCAYCPYNADRDFNNYIYHVVMGDIGYRAK